MLDGVNILIDKDPGNDMSGYIALADAFLFYGDMSNAAIMFTITCAPLDKLKSSYDKKQRSSGGIVVLDPDTEEEVGGDSGLNVTSGLTDLNIVSEPTEKLAVGNTTSSDSATDTSITVPAQQKSSATDISTLFRYGCDGKCRRKVEDFTALYFCTTCLEVCFCDVCIELVRSNKLRFRICNAAHTFYQAYPVQHELVDLATIIVDGEIRPRQEWLEELKKEWAA